MYFQFSEPKQFCISAINGLDKNKETPNHYIYSTLELNKESLLPKIDWKFLESIKVFVPKLIWLPQKKLAGSYFLASPNIHQNRIIVTPQPEVINKKRMVITDGSNVAYGHSHGKRFSVEGLKICLDYFSKRGYDAKAVVPQMRLKALQSSNPTLLANLHGTMKVILTPCKNLPNGKTVVSYDDRFILDFALDAAVIANDNYLDLSRESKTYLDLIKTRVIGFAFLNDTFILPQDPYGKRGPSLSKILTKN